MNKRTILFSALLLIFLLGVGAVSAADDSTIDSSIDIDNTQTNDVQEISEVINTDNSVASSDITSDAKVVKSDVQENNKLAEAKTIVITNETFDQYFTDKCLNDNVTAGDTLDFQGFFYGEQFEMNISKPVNIISSTKDAYIELNSTGGSLLGTDPVVQFQISNGGSYTNMSGIYFHNSQFIVRNATYVNIENCSMIVEDRRVGSGIGQTTFRENVTYSTLKNCVIYTKNNGGSSSMVFTWADNCTVENCTIQGEGNVGNLFYLNTYNLYVDVPSGVIINSNNTFKNNRILGPSTASGTCNGITLNGHNNSVINNTMNTRGAGVTTAFGGSFANATVIGNTLSGGCSLSAGTTIINNTVLDGGQLSASANATVINNTAARATISAANVTFLNNNIAGNVSVTQANAIIANNTIGNLLLTNSNSKNITVTNNQINGKVVLTNAKNNTIVNNTIFSTEDAAVNITNAAATGNVIANNSITTISYAGSDAIVAANSDNVIEDNTPEPGIVVNITDDTYANFFDENGELNDSTIVDYSTINLLGEFNKKVFTFNNVIVKVTGINAVLKDSVITSTDDARIYVSDVIIENTDDALEHAIVLESEFNKIANVVINQNTTAKAQVIYITGDKNIIDKNTITVTGPSNGVDYMNDPNLAPVIGIAVLSSDNTITNNNVYVTGTNATDGGFYGTVEAITLQGNNAATMKAENNFVTNNKLTVTGPVYVYGINMGPNVNKNNVSSNTISLTSDSYAAGISVMTSPALNNVVASNTINITAKTYAYGVIFNAYFGNINNNNISRNNINATADQVYLIELFQDPYGSTAIQTGTIVQNNNLYGTGNYTIGIATMGDKASITSNKIILDGKYNDTLESYDFIKPTTAGILVQTLENSQIVSNTINITNGPAIKVLSSNNNIFNSSTIVSNDSVAVFLNNSNGNIVSLTKANTTSTYAISLENSTDNEIISNVIVANLTLGGDAAISQDEASTGNTLFNNTPTIYVVTDDNYASFFDENSRFTKELQPDDIITIGSDLYNKDLIFDNLNSTVTSKGLSIKNQGNYTIYNGTVIVTNQTDEEGNLLPGYAAALNITGLNFDNVDKPVFINNLTSRIQKNFYLMFNNIKVTGDDVVVISSSKEESYCYVELSYSNVTATGKNVKVVDFQAYAASSGSTYVNYNNITVEADETAYVVDVKLGSEQFKYNNVDMKAKDVAVAINNYGGSYFYSDAISYNNITGSADLVMALNYTPRYGTSSSTYRYNNINLSSDNPITAINITNATSTTVSYNNITVNSENGEVPVVNMGFNPYTSTSTSYYNKVQYNYIEARDVAGNAAAKGDNLITVSSNYPTSTYADEMNVEIPDEITMLDEIQINATTTNVFGDVLEGEYTITIDGVETTMTTSEVVIDYKPDTFGDKQVTIKFVDPNGKYNTTTTTKTLTVNRVETTITLDDVTGSIFDDITLTANVVDASGNAVSGGRVSFKVNGNYLKDADGNYVYANVKDGVATATFTAGKNLLGNNTISAKFAGNKIYSISDSEEAALTLDKQGTVITVDPIEGVVNQTVTVVAHVVDMSGNAVSGGRVSFKVNGNYLKDAEGNYIYVDVKDGIATFDYIAPKSWIDADFTITAYYRGNANYAASTSEEAPITIEKQETKIAVANIDANKGGKAQFTAFVFDTFGKAVNGGRVGFKVNGNTLKDADGNAVYANVFNGVGSVSVDVSSRWAEENVITAIYGGNSFYAAIRGNATMTISE